MIIARITIVGHLELRRGKEIKNQQCPYQEGSSCGDWCPLFMEPNYQETTEKIDKDVYLQLCNNLHIKIPGKNFEDLRKQ